MATDSTGRSIIRIADILNCFSVEEPVHNLTAISKRLELPKSTTHRLLTTLVSQGFLMRDVHGRGYQLGYQLLHWGMVAQAALDLRNEALPILRALSKSVGETAILTVRDGIARPLSGDCRVEPTGAYDHAGGAATSAARRRILEGAAGLSAGGRNRADSVTPSSCCHSPEHDHRSDACCAPSSPPSANAATQPRLKRPIRARWGSQHRFTTAPVSPVAGIGIAAPLTRIPPERVAEVAPAVIDAGHQLSARLGAPRPGGKQRT